ncbi:hypothetical protein [Parabacteroides chongii]|uniref:hypothetical protein n=1 Tax=Parabacteroides chongii TaxID=2685834 RepID=UPI00240D53D6|nr:hypothetical protein [Parabacteroides chongii]WFE85952.1 hypothetical protein P3L47_04950 [Parabacteroides chongii]
METEEIKISTNEWLTDALKRQGYKNIPSNVILDKTLTGLGATYTELHSQRNSIILEPNVPVILEKTKDNPDWLAVWEKCTQKQVETYLKSPSKNKKLICTPESFLKIRKAADKLHINIYSDYFCLMDECEKYIQDVDYRKRITQPVYDFFQFQNKALVSATPLEMRHQELVNQNFRKLKIIPEYDYRKNLELIVTNSYDKTVKSKLDDLRDSFCICIFLNSTNGINKIINTLQLTDYKVFCSNQSVNKLKEREFEDVYEMLEPLAKYNFFTCRFFSALDIKLKQNPDILILTDLNEAIYTMIDPFTEAIQIQGRFRNGFNSLTHITTVKSDLDVKSKDALDSMIEEFEITYSGLKSRLEQVTDKHRKQAISKDMDVIKYADLLDAHGEINNFCIDNLYNEERVKAYYTSDISLLNAYEATNYFNVRYSPVIEPIGTDFLLILRKAKTDIEKRRIIASQLDKLYFDFNRDDKLDISFYVDILKKEEQGSYTIDAYLKIGKEGLEKAEYKKGAIDKAVKKYDKEIHRFLPEVLNDIEAEFELNVPMEKTEIRERLEMLYKKHCIIYTVRLNTIEDYYLVRDSHSKKPAEYILTQFISKLG